MLDERRGALPGHAEIFQKLGQLDGRMDGMQELMEQGFAGIHEKIDDALTRQGKGFDDHEGRLRTVEKHQHENSGGWRWLVTLGGAACGAAGLIATFAPLLAGGM